MQAEVRQAAERLKFLLDYAMLPGMYSHHVQWEVVDFWSPGTVCFYLLVCYLSCSYTEEDIKLNNQTFNWPGRMDPIFEVSQQRLATRREKAENELNERYIPAIRGRWTYCIVERKIGRH